MRSLLLFALRPALPALLAAAVALAPAGQARATGLTDAERIVIGLGGAALLGLALSSPGHYRGYGPGYYRGYPVPYHAPVRVLPPPPPPIAVAPAYPVYGLPGSCVTPGRRGVHSVHVLPQPCLTQYGVGVHRLPTTCRVQISGIGWGFYVDCLRGRGWHFY